MFIEPYLKGSDRGFLEEVRGFLAQELTPDIVAAEDAQRSMVADQERGNAWVDKLRPRRWHVPRWPEEHGGAGLTPFRSYLLNYEMGLQGTPFLPMQGLSYIGPTVIEFGTEAQKADVLPKLVDGIDTWCQGFSEPGAGSDLAGVQCFAERRGDAYFINGSKIWTTDGHNANRMFVLVRTTRENTRDAISFLLVDMDTPGVSVQPIRLLTGDHELNQVFFDDVEVPVDALLGEEGGGWAVARFLLEIERGSFVFGGRLRRRLDRLVERARETGADQGATGDALRRLALDLEAYECTELRMGHAAADLGNDMAEASLIKVEWTELLQRMDQLAVAISGAEAVYAEPAAWGATNRREGIAMPGFLSSYFNNLAASIYGGSNEVQRNLIYRALRRSAQ